MLQSEEYQLREKELQMIQEKGGQTVIDSSAVIGMTNPVIRRISRGGEEDE